MLSIAKVSPAGGRRILGAASAALLAAAMVVGSAGPADATCGDHEYTRYYNGSNVGGYYMGSVGYKQSVGCYAGNVRHSSHTANHRGQWLSDAGSWNWSTAGVVSITAGTQSPVKVLIDGPISVGRALRIGSTYFDSWGKWWF